MYILLRSFFLPLTLYWVVSIFTALRSTSHILELTLSVLVYMMVQMSVHMLLWRFHLGLRNRFSSCLVSHYFLTGINKGPLVTSIFSVSQTLYRACPLQLLLLYCFKRDSVFFICSKESTRLLSHLILFFCFIPLLSFRYFLETFSISLHQLRILVGSRIEIKLCLRSLMTWTLMSTFELLFFFNILHSKQGLNVWDLSYRVSSSRIQSLIINDGLWRVPAMQLSLFL